MRRLKTTFWGEGGGIYCCTITIFYHILIVTHILLKIFRALIIIIGREIVTPSFYLEISIEIFKGILLESWIFCG